MAGWMANRKFPVGLDESRFLAKLGMTRFLLVTVSRKPQLEMKPHYILIAVLGAPLFIAGAVFGPAAFDVLVHRRTGEVVLIPAGYSGWVRVDFRIAGAPPLLSEDGHRVIRVSGDGTLRTSSNPTRGHGKDQYFYYSGSERQPLSNAGVCKGGMIWGNDLLVDERNSTPFLRFYVGTEKKYRHEVDPEGNKFAGCE